MGFFWCLFLDHSGGVVDGGEYDQVEEFVAEYPFFTKVVEYESYREAF